MWPALAADGKLFPCPHTAHGKYDHAAFADLNHEKSLVEVYRRLLETPSFNCKEIGCDWMCPSVLGSFQEQPTANS